MGVVYAGLVDVITSPTVTPVDYVYQLINNINVLPTPPTTTVLSAWRISTPAGEGLTYHLAPTSSTTTASKT